VENFQKLNALIFNVLIW